MDARTSGPPDEGARPPLAAVPDIAGAAAPAPVERSPENDAVYRAIRSEIQFELGLVTARVNWLLVSQAFLFMPLIFGTKGASLRDGLLYPLIPALGVTLCLLILVSILAAAWRSAQWRAKARSGAYADELRRGEFSIVLPHAPAIPVMGFVGAIGVPVVLAATWLLILAAPPGAG